MPKDSPYKFSMVPARRSNEATATKRARRIILVLMLAASLSVVALLTAFNAARSTVDLSSVNPRGRAIADAAAFQALSTQKVQLPAAASLDLDAVAEGSDDTLNAVTLPYEAQSITWVGFTTEQFGSANGTSAFEVHRYLIVPKDTATPTTPQVDAPVAPPADPAVEETPDTEIVDEETLPDPAVETPEAEQPAEPDASEDPNADPSTKRLALLELNVSVAITPEGPRLAAAPSLSPWIAGTWKAAGQGDYSQFPQIQNLANAQTASQVAKWALAYATNDSDTLLTLTGDSNPAHRYVGLEGFTIPGDAAGGVQILTATPSPTDDSLHILRVRVQLESTTQTTTPSQQPFRFYSDFDLLVGQPESAQPTILAWGPAGSAAGLQPFSNALAQ